MLTKDSLPQTLAYLASTGNCKQENSIEFYPMRIICQLHDLNYGKEYNRIYKAGLNDTGIQLLMQGLGRKPKYFYCLPKDTIELWFALLAPKDPIKEIGDYGAIDTDTFTTKQYDLVFNLLNQTCICKQTQPLMLDVQANVKKFGLAPQEGTVLDFAYVYHFLAKQPTIRFEYRKNLEAMKQFYDYVKTNRHALKRVHAVVYRNKVGQLCSNV